MPGYMVQNYKQRAMKWSELWRHKTLLVLCERINHKHCPSLAMCVVYVCIMYPVQVQLIVNMALNVWIIEHRGTALLPECPLTGLPIKLLHGISSV